MDFRSERRVNPGLQDNFNPKGLISDQGVKNKPSSSCKKPYREKSLGKPE
jgi:beta-glucuronidase